MPPFWDSWKNRADRKGEIQTAIDSIPDISGKSSSDHKLSGSQQSVLNQAHEDIMSAFLADPKLMTTTSPHLETYGKQAYSAALLRGAARVPWVSPIIRTMLTHLGKFGRPAVKPGEYGYQIQLKPQYEVSDENTKIASEISEWFRTCGTVGDTAWDKLKRDSFVTYLKKIGKDSLILDSGCTEIRKGKNGVPEAWQAVDGGTIFKTKIDPRLGYNPYDAAYIQVLHGQVVAGFSIDEMAYLVRNVDSDISTWGYGSPELLLVSRVIMNILMAYDYNQKFFQQGGPAGVLVGTGRLPENQFASFVRQLRFMTSGHVNAHRLPVINLPEKGDMKWLQFNGFSNRDMGYYEWILMNMKFVAANFQIALEETGFYMGREGEGGSFVQSNDFNDKIKASQSKGLSDLLDVIEDMLNKNILSPHGDWNEHRAWGRFEFKFVGLDSKTNTQDMAELATKLTNGVWTINEAREKLFAMPPIEGGDIVRDADFMGERNAKRAEEQNAAMMAAKGGDIVDPNAAVDNGEDWNLPEVGTETEVVEDTTTKSLIFDL